MERFPEPELMSTMKQARAYAEADFEEAHSNFMACLRTHLDGLPKSGTALDLGFGAADISIRFAQEFTDWKVHGLDGSRAMLGRGNRAVVRAGLEHRITLEEMRFQEQRAPAADYTLVFSNSVLHHLKSSDIFWQSIRQHVKPGGWIFVMDLMRPKTIEHARDLADRYCCEPDVLQRDYFNSLKAAYRLDELMIQLYESGLSHLQTDNASDCHLMAWGNMPLESDFV